MEAASMTISATKPQHLRALARANEVRLARAALKRSIAAGEMGPDEVVRHCPWEAETMTVGELLRSQPRWGRARSRKLLVSLSMSETRQLGRLTHRQRVMLADELAQRRRGCRSLA